jgi:hypothetical protein
MIWLASEFNCWLYFVESPSDRQAVAQLVDEAHNRHLNNPGYLAERSAWIGSGEPSRRNGLTPLSASEWNALDVGPADNGSTTDRWQERDRELFKSTPALFVMGTSDDTPFDWVRAGEAIQRILLKAQSENVSASFLNQPCQIPDLRERLRMMTGRSGPPQLLLRMGYGTGSEPTSRRPVRDVILPSLE